MTCWTTGPVEAYMRTGDTIAYLGRIRDLIANEPVRPLEDLQLTMNPLLAARFSHWRSILKRRERKRLRRRAKRGQKRQ